VLFIFRNDVVFLFLLEISVLFGENSETVLMDKAKQNQFFRLYNEIQLPLRSFLLMMVHGEDDAEDILQETSSVLWEKFEQFQEGTNFRAWAYKTGKNQALLFLRKKRSSGMVFSEDILQKITTFAETSEDIPYKRKKALQHCVDKLTSTDRSVLDMRYQKQLSVKEIADQMNRSINGFYKTLTRIHTALKICIERTLNLGDMV
jgi:RNA polymerase sigma-70 factor (ECF subfamily)